MSRLRLLPVLLLFLFGSAAPLQANDERPNILFAIADDWGWPHASAYDDPVVKTPTFDRVAREGILFENAFVTAPSCTPSRNTILTGQYHWRLGYGANLWSRLNTKHQTYPHLLEDAGYFTGHFRKSWGPGNLENWPRHPAGKKYKSFTQFLEAWPRDQPFCFWFGASDPHRGYKKGSGQESGMDLSQIELFPHFPDSDEVRSDVADYYWEVQRFDRELGEAIDQLAAIGQLDNTIVVVTGDHGMPFPRCKSNLYDSGVRVPMAVQWPAKIKPGRTVTDFVSTQDLAPTFLELAQVPAPQAMTGRSWTKIFGSPLSGRIESERDHLFTGKERHVLCQEAPDTGGTPMRAIRTDDYLLIRNFTPDRWPAGTPDYQKATIPGVWLGDCDNGPTKTYMVDHQDEDADHRWKYDLAFGKRPEYELYVQADDPGQLKNVAADPAYRSIRESLNRRLTAELRRTGDPRIQGNGVKVFDETKYLGRGPRHPDSQKNRSKK
ncbi:MAG: sulfatase [Planctomycetota bacterium]|nr:sulfatase [Planctomycetota bacterium]